MWTPGCDCSNRGITLAIETLSKYQTVSSVVGVLVSAGAVGAAGPQAVRSTAVIAKADAAAAIG
jgi:hypothetical protein